MEVENLVFEWKVTGTNHDADMVEVATLGHKARVFRSFDNGLWNSIVDQRGTRNFESEASAKEFAEAKIKQKIIFRFNNATADLALFKDKNLTFLKTSEKE